MPTWLVIVLAVAGGIFVISAIVAAILMVRLRKREVPQLEQRIQEANRALALAHAGDKGWERGELDRAARAALERERPGGAIERLELVLVDDRPGIAEDRAVFEVTAGGGEPALRLTLGRREDGTWDSLGLDAGGGAG